MKINFEYLDPPTVKKKKKKKGLEEFRKEGGVRFRYYSVRCSNCMQPGHNYKTCEKPRRPNLKIRKNKKRKEWDEDVSSLVNLFVHL